MSFPIFQKRGTSLNSATSIPLAFSSNVTSGNLLLAIIGGGAGVATGTDSVTDTQGNTYTQGVRSTSIDDNSFCAVYYTFAGSSGANTITWAKTIGPVAGDMNLIIVEVGLKSGAVDQTNFRVDFPTPNSTGNITTTVATEYLVAIAQSRATTNAWSVDSGFTLEQTQANSTDNLGFADQSVSATGTYHTTWSQTSAVAVTAIISFTGTPVGQVGNTRYGVNTFLQPAPGNSIPYRLCVNNNRLYCVIPDFNGIFSCFVYYLGRENNQGGYWYRYVIDPAALFSEEDGLLFGGFGDGGVGDVYVLDAARVTTFAGSNINIALIFPFSKNDPFQRKDVFHLRLNIDTGGTALTLTGFTEFGGRFALGTITTTGLTQVDILIQGTAFNLAKRLSLGMNGALAFFKLVDWSIDYDARPEPLSFLRIATNYGLAAKKRLRTIPIVIDTRGNAVNINVTVDGVAYGNQSFTTNERVTVFYYFNTDVFATDIIINITAITGNTFEYYEAPSPVNVETLPVGKLFDQIGPIELERSGALLEFRVRMVATTNVITYNVYMDDAILVNAQTFAVTPNIDKTYGPIKVPKGIIGSVCRIEFLATTVFYRWNCKLKFTTGGTKSDTKQVTIQDPQVGRQS